MSHRLATNLSALLASQVTTWTLTLVWTLIVPRELGPSGVALLVMAWSVSSLLTILGGVASKTLLVKEIAANPAQAPALLAAAIIVRLGLIAPCVFLTLGYAWLGRFHGRQAVVLVMAALIAIATLSLEPFQSGFQAIERMQYLAFGEVINKGLVTAAGIALVLLGFDGVWLVGAMVLGAAIVLALNAVWLRGYLRLAWRAGLAMVRPLIRGSLSYWAFTFFYTFYLWIDSSMLILMAPARVVGWYGVPTKLFTTLLFAPVIVATAWLPRMSAAFVQSPSRLKAAARTPIELIILAMLPISVGALLVAQPLVRFLYGPAFDPAALPLALLALTLLPMSLNIIAYNLLVASNRQAVWTAALGAACVLNPALNFALIRFTQEQWHNGAIGAAASLLITELAMAVAGLLIVREYLDRGMLNRIGRIVTATAGMGLAVATVRGFGLFAQVGVGAVVFLALTLALRVTTVAELRTLARALRPGGRTDIVDAARMTVAG